MFSTRWIVFAALVLVCDGSEDLCPNFETPQRTQSFPPSPEDSKIITCWFPQILDHSQPAWNATIWNQSYAVKSEFYKAGGPFFLLIGGESNRTAEDLLLSAGAMEKYAKNHTALMIALQHRYYGESHPTSDLSVENLKYLSSEQALADLAYFITTINQEFSLPANTKWVAFGGSYPGNLAAWLRYKYPHLVHAAVASSAPVLAKVDFPEFLDVVNHSLALRSEQCVEVVKAAIREITENFKIPTERKNIADLFEFDIKDEKDLQFLLSQVVDHIGNKVLNGVHSINSFCSALDMVRHSLRPNTPMKRLARTMNPPTAACYKDYIESLRDTNWNRTDILRQWMYQTCTEFGSYQTSASETALFGQSIPVNYYIQQCEDTFGERFTEEFVADAVARTNMMYGGLDLPATRVVYVHGSVDPWHKLGITQTRILESPVIFINGTSHCADLASDNMLDPPALRAARNEISLLIGKWLNTTDDCELTKDN